MAGYNGFSKSNNAVDAEECGRFPASILAKKLGVKAQAIKALMEPCEWHHTSKRFNVTDYYDSSDMLAVLYGCEPENEESPTLFDALCNWKPVKKEVKIFENCTINWLEWGGTRKHPKATEWYAENATVQYDGGQFVEIYLPEKHSFHRKIFRKKIGSNGFFVSQAGGRIF